MTGKDKGNLDRILEGNEPKKKVRRRVKKQPEKRGFSERKMKKDMPKTQTAGSIYSSRVSDRGVSVNDIGPSKFRQKSADWMSDMEETVHQEHREKHEGFDFGKWMKSLTPVQWAAGFMAVVLFVTSVTGTVAYANYQGEQKLTEAFETLAVYEEMAASSEITSAELETVEVPLAMEEAPEMDEAAVKTLSLVLTSVEKDLKIKVVDGEDTLVKGIEWKVNVTDEDDKSTEFVDDDKDGVIHATDMAAGDYSVALVPDNTVTEYTFPTEPMTVAVKAKVEYKVIQDIKDEIKKESEVNVAAEDTGGQQAADVEQAAKLTDTVEWVESTKTPKGSSVDGYEEAKVAYIGSNAVTRGVMSFLASIVDTLRDVSTSGFSASHILSMPMGFLVADISSSSTTEGTTTEGTTTGTEQGDSSSSSSSSETIVEAESVNISNGSLNLTVGESKSISASVVPDTAADKTISWSSSDSNIASVSNGAITANAAGTAIIKAYSSNGKEATCAVTVNAPVVTVTYTFDPKAPTNLKAKGSTGTMTYTGLGSNGATISSVTYSGYDTSLISVAGQTVTVLKDCTTAATTTVTAKAKYSDGHEETKNVSLTVQAVDAAKSLSISGSDSVNVGESITLTAKVVPTTDTIKWQSSDTSVATVSNTGVVTGVKASGNKVTITATSSSNITAKKEITVNEKYSDNDQLYDSAKNPLYVLENGKYRLALYKDYKANKSQKFYKKTTVEEFLYTGWQTIDGLTYYFKKDNTKVTGEQIIGGVKYNFASDGALSQGSGTLGIDVSKYQPSINWASVKASGISYVIIRCGYRGASTGALIEDPYFRSHIKGAKAAGLKVGVYFFTTAITEAEAVEEASMCAALCSGYGLNYPVFMDCESSGRAGYMNLSAAQRTSIIKAFCSTIRSAGYTPGVYANKTWLTSYMNASELSGYKIWLAQYNTQVTYKGRYDLWQFTSKGSVNGISGNVDMNQSYLGY